MSRGHPDPGGGSGAWSGQEEHDQQEGRPLTSYGASEDHLPSDTSRDSDTGGGFDTRLREGSLELRMQLLEDELGRNKERNYEYTLAMERCVKVSAEQIITQKSEIERKDRIIAEMTEKMNELQEWRKKIEERTGTGNAAVAEVAQIVGGSAGSPGSWKPKRKTYLTEFLIINDS